VKDTARFAFDDPQEIVGAALVCASCLRETELLRVFGADVYDATAVASCARCGEVTEIALSPDQLCRLLSYPPRELALA
jgi:hypothetical protein